MARLSHPRPRVRPHGPIERDGDARQGRVDIGRALCGAGLHHSGRQLRRLEAARRECPTEIECRCTLLVAETGLLDGKTATSYPGVIDAMGLSSTQVLKDAVVRDGKLITSRGPGTAMDFALALIESLAGREKRDEVEAPLLRE